MFKTYLEINETVKNSISYNNDTFDANSIK